MAVLKGLPTFLQDGRSVIVSGQPRPDSLKQQPEDESPKSKGKPKRKNATPRKHK